jgi:hypothetical protein
MITTIWKYQNFRKISAREKKASISLKRFCLLPLALQLTTEE